MTASDQQPQADQTAHMPACGLPLTVAADIAEVGATAVDDAALVAGVERALRSLLGKDLHVGLARRVGENAVEMLGGSRGLVGGPGNVVASSSRLASLELPRACGTLFLTTSLPLDDDRLASVRAVLPFLAIAVEHRTRGRDAARAAAVSSVVAEIAEGALAGGAWPQLASSLLTKFCRLSGIAAMAISFAGDREPRVIVSTETLSDTNQRRIRLAADLGDGIDPEVHTFPSGADGTPGASRLRLAVVVEGRRVADLTLLRIPAAPFDQHELMAVRHLGRLVARGRVAERFRREQETRARADERQRIGDHLHDEVAQVLFSAEIALRSMIDDLDEQTQLAADAQRAHELLVRGEVQLRDWMQRLGAPESTGWAERLASVAHDIEHEFAIATAIRVQLPEAPGGTPELSGSLAGALVRAVREGLVNAAKHAQPCRIELTARIEDAELLVVTVTDDGPVGPIRGAAGHGLAAVRRMLVGVGGTVRLERDRAITRYTVTVPLLPGGI